MTLALAALIYLVGMGSGLYEKKMHRPSGSLIGRRSSVEGGHAPAQFKRSARVRRVAAAALWACAMWVHYPAASAQNGAQNVDETTTWDLRVAADSECARVPRFHSLLQQQIPPSVRAAPGAAELIITVKVDRPSPGKMRARIEVRDTVLDAVAGGRELELPRTDCGGLAEQLGLVVGVLVESGRGALRPPPPEEEPPEKPDEPESNAEEEEPAVVRPPRRNWRGPKLGHDLEAGLTLGWGLLPAASLGVHGAWGIRAKKPWGIRLRLAWWFPRSTTESPGSAEFRSVYGGFGICPRIVQWQRFRGRVCGEFAVGALWGQARGFEENYRERRTAFFFGAELGGDVRLLGPLYAGLSVHALAPLIRDRFVFYNEDGTVPDIHQPTVVTIAGVAAVGLRFR